MYETGDGVVRDIDQAMYWYEKKDQRSSYELEKLLNIKELMLFTL